jgi:heme oxygenase
VGIAKPFVNTSSQRGYAMFSTTPESGAMRATGPANEHRHAGSRREALRLATQDLHRALDASVAGYELRRMDHYSAFLSASAAPLIALEQMLENAGVKDLLPEWPARRRTEVITNDLMSLSIPVTVLQLRRALPTRSEIYGILYVLERSRVGARLLYARIQASDDAQVRGASAYLGAHDPALWRSFLKVLEATPEITELQDLVAGALFAFALFQRSFDRLMPADARVIAS